MGENHCAQQTGNTVKMQFIFISFLIFSPLSLVTSQVDSMDPIVSTWSGKVAGQVEETSVGNMYYKFLGVPYAEPPIGKLRFKDPVAKAAWNGIINATKFSEKCLQKPLFDESQESPLLGSEDCLFLNIYTPSLPSPGYWAPKSLKPVMFWIHGGGFTIGDGNENYNPELFIDEDVLVVTVQYRLGPFGFLALENNPKLAGNIGLKDQQEALKWINQNIQYFGGDPAKVTLFGESAGAISVHAHVLSPRIKNIFQGAILQSGTALMRYEPMIIEKEVQKSSQKFLEKIGCNVPDVIDCLQNKDVETLMEISPNNTKVEAMDEFEAATTYWMVQDYASTSPVLPYNPMQQLTVGNVKKVPMIVGITKDDGGLILIADPRMKEAFDENNTTQLMGSLGLATKDVTDEDEQIVNIMKRFYLTEGSYEDNEKNLMEMSTDSWFGSPAAEVTKLHDKVAPVYPYVLNERCIESSLSLFLGGGEKDYGVSHGDDLICMFGTMPFNETMTESGKLTSQAMIKTWTNFAKYEVPSPYLTSEPAWPRGEIMFFEEESGLKKNGTELENLMARTMLWDKLYWQPREDMFGTVGMSGQSSIFTYIVPYNWF